MCLLVGRDSLKIDGLFVCSVLSVFALFVNAGGLWLSSHADSTATFDLQAQVVDTLEQHELHACSLARELECCKIKTDFMCSLWLRL